MACAAVAVGAPVAGASTVTNAHDPLATAAPVTFTAGAGEANRLTLSGDGTTLTFTDAPVIDPATAGLDTVDDCKADSTTSATCPETDTTVDLGDGDDTLALGAGLPALQVNGGAGTDQLDFSARTDSVSVDLGGTTAGLAVSNVEDATGGSGNDTIAGDSGNNIIAGGAGDDTLSGGSGGDTLRGGTGNDTLTAGDGGDVLVGGPGTDTFVGGAGADDIVAVDGVKDTITCGPNKTDNVVADLGVDGVTDKITNPADCASIRGTVATTTIATPIVISPTLAPIAPVPAPGTSSPADLTPPSASMRTVARQRTHTILVKGMRLRVTCQESCGISIALSVTGATAKRLGLGGRSGPVVIGTGTAVRNFAGTSSVRVKFTKRARTALHRTKRTVTTTAQVLVSDASGNGTLLSRRITLVRP